MKYLKKMQVWIVISLGLMQCFAFAQINYESKEIRSSVDDLMKQIVEPKAKHPRLGKYSFKMQ